jgi:uncharacterized protein with HEPN domain
LSTERALFRAEHIKLAILDVRTILHGVTYDRMVSDVLIRSAFERQLEILSEASRHLPEAWQKDLGPEVPWHDVRNIGNILRHTYHLVEYPILWRIYTDHFDPLEAAIDAMIAAHGPIPRPPLRSP